MSSDFFQGERFSTTVERKLREWQEEKKDSKRLSSGAEINYITLSRQVGSGGEEVAKHLAELMGWSVFDKRILDFMAENFGIHKDVLESVDERTRGWIEDTLSMFFSHKSSHIDQISYYKHLMEALFVTAKHGRAIVVGRAAGHVLPREHGLSVRVTAPFEVRSERYAEDHHITLDKARTVVKKRDEEQRGFIKDFVGHDVDDEGHYDIICNTGELPPRAVAKIIWRAFDQRIVSKQEQSALKAEGEPVSRIVEHQMEKWQSEKKDHGEKRAHLVSGKEIDYITIGRSIGSGGNEIARMLSDLIKWPLYDYQILNYMAENMDVHVKALESLDEKNVGWVQDRLIPLFSSKAEGHITQSEYNKHLAEVLLVIARHGDAIILGRAAGQLLPRDKGLSVRITAPYKLRYLRYAQENELSIEDAMAKVKKTDREQVEFTEAFTGKKVTDAQYYDIVFNTEKLNPTSVTRLIWRAFDQRAGGESDEPGDVG